MPGSRALPLLLACLLASASPLLAQEAGEGAAPGGRAEVLTLGIPRADAQQDPLEPPADPEADADTLIAPPGPPALNPAANPIPLLAHPPAVPEGARFNPQEWPDDAGRDGLVVPARWLWARIGHQWDARERAIRLSDPALWRAAGQTPSGWVPTAAPGVAGWLPKGPAACLASQRIAYALRLHRIPVTLEEHDGWAALKSTTCAQRWSDTQQGQATQRRAQQAADLFVPSDTPVITPAIAADIGIAPTVAVTATSTPAYPTQTGPVPGLRAPALDAVRDPAAPHNAAAIARVLGSPE